MPCSGPRATDFPCAQPVESRFGSVMLFFEGTRGEFYATFKAMEPKFMGIDVGGTNLRGKIVSDRGDVLAERKTRSGAARGIGTLMENLSAFIEDLSGENISAIGIGIPGTVNGKNGILAQAPNIKNTKDFPFVEILLEKTGTEVPVFIENDASCAALAEYQAGAGKGSDSMVMMTLGTGLGGGIILDGKLWSGEDGFGGEFGHITINPSGPECGCGSNGCVETYASLVAIKRIVKEHPRLASKLGDVEEDEIPERLENLALERDADSILLWNEFGKNLGIGISTVVNILNVKTVVVGGGLSNAWDLFIGKTEEEARKRSLDSSARGLRIKKAALGDASGVLGACYLARSRFCEND